MTSKGDSTSAASKKTPSDLPDSFAPAECPTQAEASSMLAREMNKLSVEEREKVLEDVHGIPRVVDEPQEFIEACFDLLEKELTNISNKAAYDLASSMSKEYTSSKKRRLMFLRAESYDPCNAASRMVRFFDEKCELFGADKLTKDITQDDLDPGDIAALERGIYRVLPEKDCAGRKVFCMVLPKVKLIRTMQNVLRAYYYIVMKNVEGNEEAQKRGVVACCYFMDGRQFDLSIVRQRAKMRKALPVRFDSVHVCYNDLRARPALSLAMVIMGSHSRMRFRSHYGSDEECQCQLSSFGIPISAYPVSLRGEFSFENHRTFTARERSIEVANSKGPLGVAQQAKKKAWSRQPIIKEDECVAVSQPEVNESAGYGRLMSFTNLGFLLPQPSFANPWWNVVGAPSNLPSVVVPPERELPAVVPRTHHITGPMSVSRPPAKLYKSPGRPYLIYDPLPNDILFGRGKPIQQRPGNVRFRHMIDTYKHKYEQSEKGVITGYIVHLVKEEGGRFLKEFEDRGWVEVDEATARAKVSHAFRSRRNVGQATLKKDKNI